jgi:aminoglycoside phosphotransferase (APT) family kinase protein
MARREMRISAALPQSAPVPRMLGGFDDHDWVVLLLEDIDGAHPRTPWVDGEIDVCVTGLRELAAALTPAPLTGLPTAAEAHADIFGCWELLAADPPADLDPWAASHLPALRASAARGLASLARGETLTHADIRADNILVRGDGRAVFVDWPWGCVGPAWFDRVLLAANVVFAGGDADRVIRDLDPVVVTGVFAGLTGYFERQGRLADPPGIPHVRAFQRAQGAALLPWLRARLGD